MEGFPDGLALIKKGFGNAVATRGANGLSEMLVRRFIALGLKKCIFAVTPTPEERDGTRT